MRQAPQTIGTVLPTNQSWRKWGRQHRPSVQFYLPMKVVKRVRQATQTIGTVLPTHEGHEEKEAGNVDYRYSFTYPWKSWREWGRQHKPSVQFYLPMKAMNRTRQAPQTIGTVLPVPMMVMKRMRQATQTIGTVVPTNQSHEENEAGNTDHRYSFT